MLIRKYEVSVAGATRRAYGNAAGGCDELNNDATRVEDGVRWLTQTHQTQVVGSPANSKRNTMRVLFVLLCAAVLTGCGSLEKKASLINLGDTKERVQGALGVPDDRQMKGDSEAWQYCQTGAGFGYHDYRIIWFQNGTVTGLNSYKSTRAGSSCMADIKPVEWQSAPHAVIEIRNR